jgi:hypothetical protein
MQTRQHKGAETLEKRRICARCLSLLAALPAAGPLP